MKILIMTDMEGVAGILNHDDWVLPEGRHYAQGVGLLTAEVNAAVDGLWAAGAREILVVDGHGAGGLDPEALDPRALLMRGVGPRVWPWGLEADFAGLVFVGQHAKAGTDFSHITHTEWFNRIDMRINHLSVGEYGELALCAMELGVPTLLACGEEALCREAEALTPGVYTVAGKRGLLPDGLEALDTEAYRAAKLSAVHRSPHVVREEIRETARQALERRKTDPSHFHYPVLRPPYSRTIRFRRNGDVAPYETRDEHPDSLIGLMNLPIASGPSLDG